MRRVLSILLLAAILLSLAACSSTPSQIQQEATLHNVEYRNLFSPKTEADQTDLEQVAGIYGKERIELPGNQAVLYGEKQTGSKIFAYGIDSYGNTAFYILDSSDCSAQILPIQLSDNVYLLGQSSDDLQPVMTINEDGEYVLNLFADSQLVEQTILKLPEQYSEDVIIGLTVLPNHLIVELSSEIIVLNRSSEFEKSLGAFSGPTMCSISTLGNVIIAGETKKDILSAESVTEVNIFDASLELLGTYESETRFDAFCTGRNDGEILALKNGIIYSYHYKSGEITAIIDAVSSGMNSNKVFYASDGRYITIQRGIPVFWSAINNEDLTVLTLATYHLSRSLELLVDLFNESTTDCKIRIIDYASFEDSSGNGKGLMRLNADIVAGFTPDLYDLTNLNVQSFVRNGLLENMQNHFAENGIQASELVASAFEQLKVENGLYYIMPSFSIISVIGSRDMLGEDAHLTPDRFFSLAEELSPDKLFGPELTREDLLRYALLFNREEYFDEKTKTCNFTSTSFERFLALAASFPEEIDYSQIDSQDIARVYAGEQKLMFSAVSGDLISLFSYYDTAFSGKAEYVGFPSDVSSGTAFVPTSLIGISSTSLRKEQAMDFIAFTLSDYCQTSSKVFGLPIKQDALEERVEYWVAEYEKFNKSLVTVYDGARIELAGNPSAASSKERLYAAIAATDTLAIFDDSLFQLVFSGSQSYFNGKINLQQCLENLQSKVRLYLAEQH